MSDNEENKNPTVIEITKDEPRRPLDPSGKWTAADFPHLDADKASKAVKSLEKQDMARKLKGLNEGKSKWSLTQLVLQEVMAKYVILNPNGPMPKFTSLYEELKEAIKEKYEEDPELRDFLLESVPGYVSCREWPKKEGWQDAVWAIIKDTGMFTKERRAAMIDALYRRGVEKDTVAAKIWLQMSGDFVEKSEVTSKDNTLDKYREINQVLHKKKNE
jgi:hypothetical protein